MGSEKSPDRPTAALPECGQAVGGGVETQCIASLQWGVVMDVAETMIKATYTIELRRSVLFVD
ncbi:MAG: hypothetical protein AB7S77_06250 [Desulfatirhabdiaceae bacterium]